MVILALGALVVAIPFVLVGFIGTAILFASLLERLEDEMRRGEK